MTKRISVDLDLETWNLLRKQARLKFYKLKNYAEMILTEQSKKQ